LLGITSGTSKSNLFKARDKLKIMIKNAEVLPTILGNNYTNIVAVSPINLKVIFYDNNGLIR